MGRWVVGVVGVVAACSGTSPGPQTAVSSSGAAMAGPVPFETTLEAIRERHDLPALGALAIEGGAVTTLAVTGVRAVGGELVQPGDRWHLGSNTKAMTAALFVRAGRDVGIHGLSSVSSVFQHLEAVDPSWGGVSLRQLLRHRAGLREDRVPDAALRALLTAEGSPRALRQQAAKGLLRVAPPRPPGERMRYANLGYVLVGAALENAHGVSFEALMHDRLFAPLDMRACGFGPPARDHEGAVAGHAESAGRWVALPDGDNGPVLAPAGTVHCPLADWATFLRWWMTPHEDPNHLAMLREPSAEGYAPGWMVTYRPWAEGPVYTHAGSNTLNYSVAWVVPQQQRAYAAVVNAATEAAQQGADEVIGALIALRDAR